MNTSNRRTFAIVVASLAGGFVLLVAAVYGVQRARVRTETRTAVVAQPVRSVRVDTHGHGTVRVIHRPGPVRISRRMHWAFARPAYHQSLTGTALRIDARSRETLFHDRSVTDITIVAPTGTTVDPS